MLPLIVTSDNVGTSDYGSEVVRPDETLEPTTAADERAPNRKSTVFATVKLLRGVRDSAGAFGPLKSVARYLCFILDDCEVWPSPRTYNSQCSQTLQQTEVNEDAIESLAPRVKTLSESLSAPISPGDVNEGDRAKKLER